MASLRFVLVGVVWLLLAACAGAPETSSPSDFGIVGCKSTAAVHFLPSFCPIARLWGCKADKNWSRWDQFSLTTTKVRQAASDGWEDGPNRRFNLDPARAVIARAWNAPGDPIRVTRTGRIFSAALKMGDALISKLVNISGLHGLAAPIVTRKVFETPRKFREYPERSDQNTCGAFFGLPSKICAAGIK